MTGKNGGEERMGVVSNAGEDWARRTVVKMVGWMWWWWRMGGVVAEVMAVRLGGAVKTYMSSGRRKIGGRCQ
jgi:hypothetical protein